MDPSDSRSIPFVDAVDPLVQGASSTLRTRVSSALGQLSSEAQKAMERSLLHTLAAVCGQVLELGFSLFRFRNRAVAQSSPELPCARALYEEFVHKTMEKGLLRSFAEHPSLKSTVVACTEQWISSTAEFLDRLQSDRAEVAALFNGNNDPGVITGIDTDLSDRHGGGRTVLGLQFSSGLRLVYKPKDLGTDEAYFSILDWFNRNGAPLELRTLRVLRRPGYGWQEFVEQRLCENSDEVQRHYVRAGQVLCVIYVLAGTDCHFDNLVAYGEHPILVDTEMLFQPCMPGGVSRNGDTVMRTGLLPTGNDGSDLSGFGCTTDQAIPLRIPEWQDVNSDRMRLSFRLARIQSRTGVVLHGEKPISALDYVDYITEGFRDMYRCLQAHRLTLLDPEGPLACIAHQEIRVLARGTLEYLLALSHALHPKRLRASDCLQIKFTNPSRFPFLERLEVEALQRMDVPRFHVQASARAWSPSAERQTSIRFRKSGLEHVLSGVEQLSEAHLQRQLGIIKLAWAMSGLSTISFA
jgi:class II lanthipeptide synthase